ncbi:sensor histidine kinase [Nonomuraea sp. NN258]|uniref:sensor histidine kinase n=1 Tax=Nonomuraea antri TaxID=2730852 RepID=UPI001C2C06E3|nr:sensor histidine kinase [Nonomuraea antri]NRQ36246.1 sensor histidine kinase [Nonomuraea antri]
MFRRTPPTPIDWLIAVITTVFALAEEIGGRTLAPPRAEPAWWLAAVVATGVLVLVRRRLPVTLLTCYTVASVATYLIAPDAAAAWQWYVELLLLFTVLAERPWRDRGVLGAVVLTLIYIVAMAGAGSRSAGPGDYAVALVMTAIAGGSGLAVRRNTELAAQASERGELLARQAVVEERTRIARELHDIVAHSVSVMTMQAGAVRLMLRPEQTTERETLTVVADAGREAVEELRRMLGLLRVPGEREHSPQPGLARLDDLLEQMRCAGLEVDLEVVGAPVPLPPGLELSAYRIVQESLTNTLKHAGPTRAGVTMTYTPRELRLEIVDEGGTGGEHGPPGHGLIGMRERVALFHGTLSAGPRPGGWGVRVAVPL